MKFHVMDYSGHSTIEFTEAQHAWAQAKFDELLAEGKIVGTRKEGEKEYSKVSKFEQLSDEAVFTPQRVGG